MEKINKPNMKFDWQMLRQYLDRPKLSDVCSNPKHLFDGCHQIGDSEYALVSYQWNPQFTEEAHFIIVFYWAPSLAIFQRLVSRDPEVATADDGITQPLPEGLKLAPDCKDFGTISRFVAANGHLRSGLNDQYDNNYTRVGCSFGIERLTYYFRSPSPVPTDEAPYAAALATSDDRWRKLGGS